MPQYKLDITGHRKAHSIPTQNQGEFYMQLKIYIKHTNRTSSVQCHCSTYDAVYLFMSQVYLSYHRRVFCLLQLFNCWISKPTTYTASIQRHKQYIEYTVLGQSFFNGGPGNIVSTHRKRNFLNRSIIYLVLFAGVSNTSYANKSNKFYDLLDTNRLYQILQNS